MHFSDDAVNYYFPVFFDIIKTNEFSGDKATEFLNDTFRREKEPVFQLVSMATYILHNCYTWSFMTCDVNETSH